MVESVLGGRLTDQISLGVLAASVPRDVVDEAVAVTGRGARRAGGKLPPHVMVYFTMALGLFADEDYEEVISRLSRTLASWDCWDGQWSVPTSGGITQARQRLGFEPLQQVFERVAVPVAGLLTRGAWLRTWRLMALDGFEWDAPDSPANAAEFGYASGTGRSAFPKVRVVSVSECGSHAMVDAAIGGVTGKGSGERALALPLLDRLDADWLLIADRNFYSWTTWQTAAGSGAQLLWRVSATVDLPVVQTLPDGSWLTVLFNPAVRGAARRRRLLEAARAGQPLATDAATLARVIRYTVPDRAGNSTGEEITVLSTITDPAAASAAELAEAYHQRWEHETGNGQLKTGLRGPGRVLRSATPAMVRAEIYGYLLTHYALSTLISQAATEADIDPDRVKFINTVRIVRHTVGDPPFPP